MMYAPLWVELGSMGGIQMHLVLGESERRDGRCVYLDCEYGKMGRDM